MKAIQKARSEKGCALIDAPVPKAFGSHVVCKVLATSICGTDIHIYNWDTWAQKRIKPPIIFGHEFCGEVVEVGSDVEKIKIGDRISAETHIPCHNCRQCKTGNMHVCKNLKILGVDTNGCFAEFAALPEICCIKNDPAMDPAIASVQEPLGNAVYAVSESNVRGKTVAIFGDGPTGLFAVLVARAFGAEKIIAVGAQTYRLDLIKKLGANRILDARKDDITAAVMEETNGDGVDVVLEMSGAEAAIHAGLKVLSPGLGVFTFFGIPPKPVTIDIAEEFIFKGIKINAIVGRKMFETWHQVAKLLAGGTDVRPIITHTFPLDKIDDAMQLLRHDNIQAGKIILKP